jgi:hypothetical protein
LIDIGSKRVIRRLQIKFWSLSPTASVAFCEMGSFFSLKTERHSKVDDAISDFEVVSQKSRLLPVVIFNTKYIHENVLFRDVLDNGWSIFGDSTLNRRYLY